VRHREKTRQVMGLTCLWTLILTQSALGPSSTIWGSKAVTIPSFCFAFTGCLTESCFKLLFPVFATAELLGGLCSVNRGLPCARTAFTARSSTVDAPFLFTPVPAAFHPLLPWSYPFIPNLVSQVQLRKTFTSSRSRIVLADLPLIYRRTDLQVQQVLKRFINKDFTVFHL
jgi:hypothetical protein